MCKEILNLTLLFAVYGLNITLLLLLMVKCMYVVYYFTPRNIYHAYSIVYIVTRFFCSIERERERGQYYNPFCILLF